MRFNAREKSRLASCCFPRWASILALPRRASTTCSGSPASAILRALSWRSRAAKGHRCASEARTAPLNDLSETRSSDMEVVWLLHAKARYLDRQASVDFPRDSKRSASSFKADAVVASALIVPITKRGNSTLNLRTLVSGRAEKSQIG